MNYVILPNGTHVMTTTRKGSFAEESREWNRAIIESRRWGVQGEIVNHLKSREGYYYEIKHLDGTISFYDREEFELLDKSQEPSLPMTVFVFIEDSSDIGIGFVIEVFASRELALDKFMKSVGEYTDDPKALRESMRDALVNKKQCKWGDLRIHERKIEGVDRCEWIGGCKTQATLQYGQQKFCTEHYNALAPKGFAF